MKIVDIQAVSLFAPLDVPIGRSQNYSLTARYVAPYPPHVWGSAVYHMATLHPAASIPNFSICEVDRLPNPFREELILKPMQIQNNYNRVPQQPDLGIELNEGKLRK
jgi:L-alanine-DL-glutamate epimerase-like enolase superfamily enzyme